MDIFICRQFTRANRAIAVGIRNHERHYRIHSCGPFNLQPDDIVEITFQVAVSYEYPEGIRAGVGRYILRNGSLTNITVGSRVLPATMSNIGKEIMHHLVLSHSVMERITGVLTNQFYHLVMYAGADDPQGRVVKVEPQQGDARYGFLMVKVTRKGAADTVQEIVAPVGYGGSEDPVVESTGEGAPPDAGR